MARKWKCVNGHMPEFGEELPYSDGESCRYSDPLWIRYQKGNGDISITIGYAMIRSGSMDVIWKDTLRGNTMVWRIVTHFKALKFPSAKVK